MRIELGQHSQELCEAGLNGVMIDQKNAGRMEVRGRHALPVNRHVIRSGEGDGGGGCFIARVIDDASCDISVAHCGALPLHHLGVLWILADDDGVEFFPCEGDGVLEEPSGTPGGAEGVLHEDLG